MTGLLIDDGGNAWPAEPDTIVGRFGRIPTERDVVEQAISLGFVFVRVVSGGLRVALRAHLVTQPALDRVCNLIADQEPHRVTLSIDPRLSAWELIAGPLHAIARIERIVAEARKPVPRLIVTTQTLPFETAYQIAGGRLLPLLLAWREANGRWSGDQPGRLADFGLLDHSVISRNQRDSDRFLVEHWGRCRSSLYGPQWAQIARGRDLADQPNQDLGWWNAAAAWQIATAAEPRLLAFDLVMRTPDTRLVRRTYTRLMLPWRIPDRGTILTAIDVGARTLILEPQAPARPN
jgi:hypothetical protein